MSEDVIGREQLEKLRAWKKHALENRHAMSEWQIACCMLIEENDKLRADLDAARRTNNGLQMSYTNACAEIEKLREQKRLLFEENGRLLKEKEAGLWDTNHSGRAELAEAVELIEQGAYCPHQGVPKDWKWDGTRYWCHNCHEYVRSEREFLLADRARTFLAKYRGEKGE